MKLYFYFLEKPYKDKPYIRFEECEVVNKPKTYKPVGRFPSGYYGSYVAKEDIGTLIGYGKDVVALTQNDSEVAMKLFSDNANKQIGQLNRKIEELKDELKAVSEWRSKNGSKD